LRDKTHSKEKIMQDKIENTSTIAIRRHTTKEERQLHVENWKKSGLSMSEYCRNNNIGLANLSDWKRSSLQNKIPFKPMQLSPTLESSIKLNNIIDIMVNQSIRIRLQHVSDPSLVISIIKGLTTCS